MEKQYTINKKLLCTENESISSNYDNFAMQVLSRSENGTNIIAITCDTNKFALVDIVSLNLACNLQKHSKKALVINLNPQSNALNTLLDKQNDNEVIVNYSDIDVLLPVSTDFISEMTTEQLKEKYAAYDFIILSVPSPKKMSNYLAVPKNTNYYLLVSKFISSFYAANKCIQLIDKAESNVIGSAYIKLKWF